jgi:hypothetical protein
MLQFSLRNLLIAVAAVAVGTAALLNANAWWSSLLWGTALSMLVLGGFLAFLRRESQRAFWIGYVVTGGLYLLLLMYSVPQMSQTNTWMPYGPLNYNNLVTTKVAALAYSLLPASKTTQSLPAPTVQAGATGGVPSMGSTPGMPSMASSSGSAGMMSMMLGGGMGPPMMPNPNYIDQEAFTDVGQAIWTLFLSWLGGTVMCWLYRTRSTSERAVAT